MLVQPERDDRTMYAEYLRLCHMIVVCLKEADSALAAAANADVIGTGILLPGSVDGIALIRRLRDAKGTTRMPIIVLTSCAWQTDRDRAHAAGCDAFLAKPCLPDTLLAEIRRVLMFARA